MKLVGVAEIAELVGVTRQRANQLCDHPRFPRPVARLAMGRVWNLDEVEEWRKTPRRVGRPRKTDVER